MATCRLPTSNVDRGDLLDAATPPKALVGAQGELPSGVTSANTVAQTPDKYLLCVSVDVSTSMRNTAPIPAGDYAATAQIMRSGKWESVGEEGKLASIVRNGTSAHVPYLTIAEKYNQRLMVVNRGASPAPVTMQFTSEAGVAVAVKPAFSGPLAVPARSTWLVRVSDVLSITGRERTAATLNFGATSGSLTVATTQVNLDDGSTDTVVYEVR